VNGIDLLRACSVIDGALSKAREMGYAPLAVTVLDLGGHITASKREDGAGNFRSKIAQGKASTALGMGLPMRVLAEMAAERPQFFAAIAALDDAAVLPEPGGLLIEDEHGSLLGAVGVSGDTSERDEECTLAGLRATGLQSSKQASR
jgi:uncharacterized protein GlcG (DUF336 family)